VLFLYINLDRQTDRRAFVEANFAQFSAPDWQLRRVPAIEADSVIPLRGDSKRTPSEIACFLSHIKALEIASEHTGPVMICEDDVLLGPQSSRIIPKLIDQLDPAAWDLLFPDVVFGNLHVMIDLFQLRRSLMQKQEVRCLSLANYPAFFGSTAYIVNHRSKPMILENLNLVPPKLPYDIALREQIRGGKLQGYLMFPFVTSISKFADVSTVQPGEGSMTEMIWNEFRRLMWIDRTPDTLNAQLPFVTRSIADLETYHFSKILEVSLSPSFKNK